jgi:hypothetical protein
MGVKIFKLLKLEISEFMRKCLEETFMILGKHSSLPD